LQAARLTFFQLPYSAIMTPASSVRTGDANDDGQAMRHHQGRLLAHIVRSR